jgi:hypothetical protein
MLLLCKQKDKWIDAEEDELRSFAVNNVMTKNPSLAPGQRQSVNAEVVIHGKEGPERCYHKIQSVQGFFRYLAWTTLIRTV